MLLSLRGCFSGEITSHSQKMGCDWGKVTSYFKVAANTIALELIPRDLRKHLLFWNSSALPTPHLTQGRACAEQRDLSASTSQPNSTGAVFIFWITQSQKKGKMPVFVEAWLYSEHGKLHWQFRKHAQSQWERIKCTLTENNWKFSSLS